MGDAFITRRGGGAGGGKPSPTDAVLRVTAPSGSTVTITKSGVIRTPNFYLDGTDKDTFFLYIKVADFGTYTVTATLDDKSKTETITIESPQEYFIKISYILYLVMGGVDQTEVTGGWDKVGNGTISTSGGITATSSQWDRVRAVTNQAIDMTDYNTIYLTGSLVGNASIGLARTKPTTAGGSSGQDGTIAFKIPHDGTLTDYAAFDISQYAEELYFIVQGNDGIAGPVTELYLR